jgi:transcription factor C subunit 7
MPTPTGLPTDPALSSHGEQQAAQLGAHILTLDPLPNQIISSPYYRCLQTIKPGVKRLQAEKGYENGVLLESGFEEWFGETGDHREQPGPHAYDDMRDNFFPELDLWWAPLQNGDENTRGGDGVIRPNRHGESVEDLHERVAYALHRTIERADRAGYKSILICMHAAVMLAIGRCLTGRMPDDFTEEDFHCYTASMSTYQRRKPYKDSTDIGAVGTWLPKRQGAIPPVPWRDNGGVMGGWECLKDADCSYLTNGEERGWHFSGDESFMRDPNGFNDAEADAEKEEENAREEKEDELNLNRALCTVVALAEDEMGEKVLGDIRSGRSKL